MKDNNNIVAGIDLGTTFSSLAVIDENKRAKVIVNAEGELATQSLICFAGDTILVGTEALNASIAFPDSIVREVKREMGKCDADGKPIPCFIEETGKAWTAPELSAIILKKVVSDAETVLGKNIHKAVITVPAYFNDSQRQATKDAGSIAGLEVIDIVDEPTAAAMAYGIEKSKDGTFLLVDIGGGTSDFSILSIHNGNIEVLATDGMSDLGGTDLDKIIIQRILKVAEDNGANVDFTDNPATAHDIRERAIRLKKTLSSAEEGIFGALIGGVQVSFTYTRDEFESDCAEFEEKIREKIRSVLSIQNLDKKHIQAIFAGGTTRVPFVKRLIEQETGLPPLEDHNVDEAVCKGAVIAAVHMTKEDGDDFYALDGSVMSLPGGFHNVCAHDLGVAAFIGNDDERRFVPVIRSQNAVPISCSERFAMRDPEYQTNIRVEVYQRTGSSDDLSECLHIDDLELTDLPVGPGERIEVTYSYDRGSIVKVNIKDTLSGKMATGEISNSLGLSESEVSDSAKSLKSRDIR